MSVSVSWCITSTKHLSPPRHHHDFLKLTGLFKPTNLPFLARSKSVRFTTNLSSNNNNHSSSSSNNEEKLTEETTPDDDDDDGDVPIRWHSMLSDAASFYPLYVTVGGAVACFNPTAFSWFVSRAPFSYSLSLGLIMLSMGVTLEFRDLAFLIQQRPFSILFGCIAQYTIMPLLGMLIAKFMGLPPALSVGLVLLSCCPGGTASNVVTLISRGDVALSIVMTMCTTLAAVIVTPLLTKYLAGTYVPVDAVQLSLSTMQVVVAPILLGLCFQSTVPAAVRVVTPFAPLFAVLTSSLLACSVFSENVIRLRTSALSVPLMSSVALYDQLLAILTSELGVTILSVLLLHFAGFFVGYASSAICGFRESQRRAVSIEVGMQNSSLGVVLAASHFSSPLVALPAALSAVLMNIMGSSLGFIWRNMDPNNNRKV